MVADSVLPRSMAVHPNTCRGYFGGVVWGQDMCIRVDFVCVASVVCLGSRGSYEFCGGVCW